MKGFRRIILAIISISIITGNISIAYGTSLNYIENIEERAYELGYKDGKKAADEKGQNTSYYLLLPKDKEIIYRFEMEYGWDYDRQYFRDDIIDNYTAGFIYGYYIEDELKEDDKIDSKEEKLNYVKVLGKTLGEIYGYRDFYEGNKSNWHEAIPWNRDLINRYNLDRESAKYRSSFLNVFRESFKIGYEGGYRKANFEPIKTSYEDGIKDGEYFGGILGRVYGAKDYFDNRHSDYKTDLPSDDKIIQEYLLNKDSLEYKDGFLIGFKRAYEESYNANFRAMNIEQHWRSYEEGYEQGKAAGIKAGEIYATKDYYLKLDNDWKRHAPNTSTIIEQNNLVLEPKRYREGYINGYREGLLAGYTTTFQKLNVDFIANKLVVDTIPIAGGKISSLNNSISLEIKEGTYYNPVIISIDVLPEKIYSLDEKRYIKASHFFEIEIIDKSLEANNDKDIELSFEYYGKDNGGIYKMIDDKWIYLPSNIEEGIIKTKLKPKSLAKRKNTFVVLVDKKATLFYDIRGHWAKDEINAFARRDIISGYKDGTFKPNKSISRGEFLTILSRVYGWEGVPVGETMGKFKDFNTFGPYKDVINYGISKGYIQGYPDRTFKPNNPISYKEVEIIMQRITNNKNFRWYNTAANALYQKDYRSKSYNSMNNHITRGEAVYMLYLINEWKYR